MKVSRILQIVGLATAISTALIGQAELIGEPWHHYLSIISIIGTAVIAYFMEPSRSHDRRDRSTDK